MADIMRYQRWWPLEDIEISRAHNDGRTVVALAAVFDEPYPVSDQYGDYDELVERSAFNKWLADGGVTRAMCLYNHGMTVHGSPSDMYSVPLGRPLEITPDGRGLKTITRYNDGPDVDRVLEAIRNGAIRGQSFRGRIVRSTPNNRRYSIANGKRTTVTRHELGLTDYGPTPSPVAAGAEILAIRSLLGLGTDEQLAEFIRANTSTTPTGPETTSTTSTEEAGAEEPQVIAHSDDLHSGRQQTDIARKIARARVLMEELT